MQQIGTTKSLLYGAIMIIIFAISSCEFGANDTDVSSVIPSSGTLDSPAIKLS